MHRLLRTPRSQMRTHLSGLTAITALVLACSGCTYKVELSPRDGGTTTHFTTIWVDSFGEAVSGHIELTIDEIRYTGTYVSSPGGYGLTLLKQYCPRYGEMVRSTSEWYGHAFLAGPGGRTLRCEYGGNFAKGGHGVCITDEGRLYDMIISR